MKKSLVALATLAATSAFAQFSIDGIWDVGYQAINYKGNNITGFTHNGSSTSQINFRGKEDLGGGLTADFRFESDIFTASTNANTGVASSANVLATMGSATTAGTALNTTSPATSINNTISSFGNGEIRAGLAGGFGRLDMGSVNYNTLGTVLMAQPFGTAIGSGFRTAFIADNQATSQVRSENAIKFTTPTAMGLNATLYKSFKQTTATAQTASTTTGLATQANGFSTALGAYDKQGVTEVGLNYANGPLAAQFNTLREDWVGIQALNSSSAAAGTKIYNVTTFGATYQINSAAKLGYLSQSNKSDNTATLVKNTYNSLSGTYVMGNVSLLAQFGTVKNASAASGNLTGLGVDYNLSKNTAIYGRYESLTNVGTLAVMNAAVSPTQVSGSDTKFARSSVGLRMAF